MADGQPVHRPRNQRRAAPDRRAHQQPGDDLAGRLPFPARLRHRCRLPSGHHRQERKVRQYQTTHRRQRVQRSFAGGTFLHYMLPVHAYHRYHVPVAGLVKESVRINGKVFLQVGIEDHEFSSRDSAAADMNSPRPAGWSPSTRLNRWRRVGVVAVIPVRMAHVSSWYSPRSRRTHGQGGRIRLFPIRRIGHHHLLPGGGRSPNRHQRGFRLVGHRSPAAAHHETRSDIIVTKSIVTDDSGDVVQETYTTLAGRTGEEGPEGFSNGADSTRQRRLLWSGCGPFVGRSGRVVSRNGRSPGATVAQNVAQGAVLAPPHAQRLRRL